MNLHYIENYDYLIKSLIFGVNNFNSELFYDSQGQASIGFEFKLADPKTFKRILDYLNFDTEGKFLKDDAQVAETYYINLLRMAILQENGADTISLRITVQNILAARRQDPRYNTSHNFDRATEFSIASQKDGVGLSFELIKIYEKTVDSWITAHNFDILKKNSHLLSRATKERAVLVSLAAQNYIGFDDQGNPKASKLAAALIDDHRPNAWFTIRYDAIDSFTPPHENLIMRRLYESELFGVYDEGISHNSISREYCKKLYEAYNHYKELLMKFERDHGYLVSKANLIYRLSGPDHIRNLEQSFSLAYNHIRTSPKAHEAVEAAVSYMENSMDDLRDFWSRYGDQALDHEIAFIR